MKVPTEKHPVRIFCVDGSLLKGVLYVDEGLRVIDFLNNRQEAFIEVVNVEVQSSPEVHSFKLSTQISKAKKELILNKKTIKCIEEL